MLIKGVSRCRIHREASDVPPSANGGRFFYFTVKLYNTKGDNFKYIYSIEIIFFYFSVVQIAQRRAYLYFFSF